MCTLVILIIHISVCIFLYFFLFNVLKLKLFVEKCTINAIVDFIIQNDIIVRVFFDWVISYINASDVG